MMLAGTGASGKWFDPYSGAFMNGIGAILKGTSESDLTSSTMGGHRKKMAF